MQKWMKFYAPDDGGAGGQAQPAAVETEVPSAIVDDEELAVYVDPEESNPEEDRRLLAEMKQRQAELQAQVDPVQAMKEAVAGLAPVLAPKKAAPDVSVKPSGIANLDQYKEDFNKAFFDDPFGKTLEIIGKANEMTSASVANQNLAYSKRIVQLDPDTRDHYKKWSDEVESEVARMSVSERASNPDVYKDALARVKANHIDEIIEERLAARNAGGQAATAKPAARQYSEVGGMVAATSPSAVSSSKQVKHISQAKMNEISRYASDQGIPEEAAIRLYQNRGWL